MRSRALCATTLAKCTGLLALYNIEPHEHFSSNRNVFNFELHDALKVFAE